MVKTGGYTNAGSAGYTVVDTLNKVKAEALVYTKPHTIPQVQVKSVTETLTSQKR